MPSKQIPKKIVFLMLTSLASIFLFAHSAHAAPATFTVTNTNDAGAGSLRTAIADANTNGNPADMDVIEFNIPGTGVHTIALEQGLPVIAEKVTINGYSQPGATANSAATPLPLNGTLTIVLDGSNQNVGICLKFTTGSDNSVLRGMAVINCPGGSETSAQVLVNANNVTIAGNYLGVNADGMSSPAADGAGRQETALAVSAAASGAIVGGTSAADRNIIAGTTAGSSAFISAGTNTVIYGNYLCIAKDGETPFSCILGASTVSGNTTYGGSASNKRNVISGSSLGNLLLMPGSVSTVQGNYIGTDYTATKRVGAASGAIQTAGAAENLIGGPNPGEGNVIMGSGAGVLIGRTIIEALGPLVLTSNKNAILGNSISNIGVFDYPGFGTSNLGIDLISQTDTSDPYDFVPEFFEFQGPDASDPGDADDGANGQINSPELKRAQQVGNQLTITYDLDAADSPTGSYRVEFFSNDTSTIFGSGPGETYLGSATVSPGTNKTATLTVNGDLYKKALSATTTAIDGTTATGFGSTSEFAKNISVGNATDYDADGVTDTVEDQAPNTGDGNNDGTPDKEQPTVTSLEVDSTGIRETFVTTGCSENGSVTSVDVTTLPKGDNGKDYPYGLTNFRLNCSRGDTVNVTKYIFTDAQPTSFVLRKYIEATESYRDVPGSSIGSEQVGESKALVARYSITDGGELDDDGSANGVIVDPVGLATTASLADTGENLFILLVGAGAVIAGGVWASRKAWT